MEDSKTHLLINSIWQKELNSSPLNINPIEGLGLVNLVFSIVSEEGEFILRMNKDDHRQERLEFEKEKWCIEAANNLGIPSPRVIAIGKEGRYAYMVQEKLKGVNGSVVTQKDQLHIWKTLGKYTRKYNQIKKIDLPQARQLTYHQNWEGKLQYNIGELENDQDSLLQCGAFTLKEHRMMLHLLKELKKRSFRYGLIHNDLSPRNVLLNDSEVYLIDWGNAEIDIVPHVEIGKVMSNEDITPEKFTAFLEGMQITKKAFEAMEIDIKYINLVNKLDVYRWAKGHAPEILDQYVKRVRIAFDELVL